jgi:hypothetical protein
MNLGVGALIGEENICKCNQISLGINAMKAPMIVCKIGHGKEKTLLASFLRAARSVGGIGA